MAGQTGVAWFVAGVASVTGVLGLMVGASASPVAGVAVTAVFGVVATALGLLYGKQSSDHTAQHPAGPGHGADLRVLTFSDGTPGYVGKTLVLVAISLFLGTVAGAVSRVVAARPGQLVRTFPWTAATAPHSAYEAVDWLVAAERLHGLGYSDGQIAEIYAIRAAEKPSILPGATQPISSLFLQIPINAPVTAGPGFSLLAYEPGGGTRPKTSVETQERKGVS